MNTPSSDENPPHRKFLQQNRGALPEVISEGELATLNTGLSLLFSRLREARQQFAKEGDNGRCGAFTALGALWQFLVLFKVLDAETLEVPILRLQDALASLDNNSVLPIVKPIPRHGRAPSSHAHLALKGNVAGTVRRLIGTGLSQADAHKQVASQLKQLGVRAERGSGGVTVTTIRNWCNEVSSDVSRRGTAAQMYEGMFTAAEEQRFSGLSEADARLFALKSLAAWVRSLFPELKVRRLQEVVWVFLATSERWKHACEHLEPQIFLVA
jgi:hypothetical protein